MIGITNLIYLITKVVLNSFPNLEDLRIAYNAVKPQTGQMCCSLNIQNNWESFYQNSFKQISSLQWYHETSTVVHICKSGNYHSSCVMFCNKVAFSLSSVISWLLHDFMLHNLHCHLFSLTYMHDPLFHLYIPQLFMHCFPPSFVLCEWMLRMFNFWVVTVYCFATWIFSVLAFFCHYAYFSCFIITVLVATICALSDLALFFVISLFMLFANKLQGVHQSADNFHIKHWYLLFHTNSNQKIYMIWFRFWCSTPGPDSGP